MALSFIWKKQLVWFVTIIFVIALGLMMGMGLRSVFPLNDNAVNDGVGGASNVKVAVPSLPYPTTRPGTGAPTSPVPTATATPTVLSK